MDSTSRETQGLPCLQEIRLEQGGEMSLFTEDEKNEIIKRVGGGFSAAEDFCPFSVYSLLPHQCVRGCEAIFTKSKRDKDCACGLYPLKYVKDKFWKALK